METGELEIHTDPFPSHRPERHSGLHMGFNLAQGLLQQQIFPGERGVKIQLQSYTGKAKEPLSLSYPVPNVLYFFSRKYWHWPNLIKHVWNCCVPKSEIDVIKVRCRAGAPDGIFNVTLCHSCSIANHKRQFSSFNCILHALHPWPQSNYISEKKYFTEVRSK